MILLSRPRSKGSKNMIDPNKLMRGVILALAILFASPLAGSALPLVGTVAARAEAVVSKVSVSGNSTVDTQTVINTLTLKVGKPGSAALVSSSIDALYRTGLFKTVSVTQSGSIVFVKVSENPIIASVLFQGNQRFSDAELLTMVQVAARGAFSQDRLNADVQSIKDAYTQAGYTNVSVTAQTAVVDGGRERVTFVINEGSRSGIAGINFTGNNAISASTLKGVIHTHESGILSWLLHDDTYSEEQLEVDKQLIRQYYANHGYPDTQVTSAVAEFDQAKNGYFITYTIVEGDKYTFGPSQVETSIPNLNAATLSDSIATGQGSAYSQTDLQTSASDMAVAATSQGYPFADVRPRVDRDAVNHKLNITYLVDNGPRVYVERINITGNMKTRDFVIRRELDFAEGDPFNAQLLQRDKAAIQGLGFFKSVDITTEPGSAPDKVIVDIAVVEQSTGDYGATAGYSTQDGILGELSLTERNFLGRGQYLRAAIGASSSGRTFDFSFTEPRFMGLKISTGFDLYDHITSQSQTTYYGMNVIGGQVRAGMPLTDAVSGNVFLGAEQKTYSSSGDCTDSTGASITTSGPNCTGTTDPINTNTPYVQNWPTSQIVTDGEITHKAFVGYNLNYNTLDDQKHPTTGFFGVLSQQYDGWDFNYVKTEVKGRYFVPLGDTGMVASVRGQAGIINNLGGNPVDATEAFKEGSGLVRGFEAGGFGPRLQSQAAFGGIPGEYLGETAYAGLSTELQFPIPLLPETYGVDGAVWADAAYIDGVPNIPASGGQAGVAGTLDPGSTDNPLKASVGASVIWDSPFGPLRGDFGYVLSKASSDRPQVFQITMQSLL